MAVLPTINKIVKSFNTTNLFDAEKLHNVYRIDIHSDDTIRYHSYDCDGKYRFYNTQKSIFEEKFKVNIDLL